MNNNNNKCPEVTLTAIIKYIYYLKCDFYPFIVTFIVVELPWNKLVYIVIYVETAINRSAINLF